MDEALIKKVTELVLQKLQQKPRALLIGQKPEMELCYTLTDQPPYEALVIGSLTASELLMPPEPVLQALLQGKPVLVVRQTLPHLNHAGTAPRALLTRLQEAEQLLYRWGAVPLEQPKAGALITAQQARQLRELGQNIPHNSRLTPLAREILEGKER